MRATEELKVEENERLPPLYNEVKEAIINMQTKQRCWFKLKRIIYTYIVTQLITIKDRQKLAHVFMKMDKDNDGLLMVSEIMN